MNFSMDICKFKTSWSGENFLKLYIESVFSYADHFNINFDYETIYTLNGCQKLYQRFWCYPSYFAAMHKT